jgi:hypothetical protein
LVNLLSLKEKLYFLLRFTTHKLHELLPPKKAQSQQPRSNVTLKEKNKNFTFTKLRFQFKLTITQTRMSE